MSEYKVKDYLSHENKLNCSSKILIVTSEFNDNYTSELERKNIDFLKEKWFTNIHTYKVPWALEIPWIVNKLLYKHSNIDLVICLWVVIKWETPHFNYVCNWSSNWIANLTIKYTTPIINWILTCLTEEQVKERISNAYAISWLKALQEYNKI